MCQTFWEQETDQNIHSYVYLPPTSENQQCHLILPMVRFPQRLFFMRLVFVSEVGMM